MDDYDSRTADQPQMIPLRDDRRTNDSLEGLKIAFVDFQDDGLAARLQNVGALVCDLTVPQLDVVVLDAASSDAQSLRDRLPSEVIDRLRDGGIQVIGRRPLRDLFEDTPPAIHRLYTRCMVADLVGVPVSTIRSWQRRGLIQPVNNVSKLPYFDFQEVSTAKQLATLVELGITPSAIRKNLRKLAAWLPQQARPLNQFSILVEGKRMLLRQADGLVEPGGQRRLDFDHTSDEGSVSSGDSGCDILPFQPLSTPTESLPEHREDWIDIAERLEQAGELMEAVQVYRTMQLACGPDAEICLRIGELLFRAGDLAGARERFYTAIELDETLLEARAALGCVLAEQGQLELATSAFQGALNSHPDYADVHFHLARIYQNAGDRQRAIRHWQRFEYLSPTGPWADEARCQLKFLQQTEPDRP